MRLFKQLIFVLALTLISTDLFGQLAIQLASNQRTYMQFEPIYFQLKIRNDTGRPMVFGENAAIKADVFFEVQDSKYKPIKEFPLKAVSLSQGKVINPGQIAEIVFRFNDIYHLENPGVYRIHAFISHPQLEEKFRSNDIRIDISRGSEIWSREIGLPENYLNKEQEKVTKSNSRIFRIKSLVDGTDKYFYCVLEDKNQVYQIIRLGRVYGIDLPQHSVDMAGILHVLVPFGSKLFRYYQIDIDGEFAQEIQYIKSTKYSPSIIADSNGKVSVAGGEIAIPNVDYIVETPEFFAQ